MKKIIALCFLTFTSIVFAKASPECLVSFNAGKAIFEKATSASVKGDFFYRRFTETLKANGTEAQQCEYITNAKENYWLSAQTFIEAFYSFSNQGSCLSAGDDAQILIDIKEYKNDSKKNFENSYAQFNELNTNFKSKCLLTNKPKLSL